MENVATVDATVTAYSFGSWVRYVLAILSYWSARMSCAAVTKYPHFLVVPRCIFTKEEKSCLFNARQSGSRMDVLTRESISFKAGRSASDASSCCADWAERYGLTKVLSGAFLTKDARELWKCHGIHKVEEGHKPGLKQWCNENKLRHVPSHQPR